MTNDNKKVYFGQASASDFTLHKDEARKQRYINRHKKNENWNNKDTAGFWSRWLLWEKPTIKESYDNIKKKFNI
jgi:Tfp pilus assembly protein FimT